MDIYDGKSKACHEPGHPSPSPTEWWEPPPPPSRAPSLCQATVSLTPSASFNGICNRQ